MSTSISDTWIRDEGPAAVVLRLPLMPVEGADAVFFPATFAASEDGTFPGGYNIDEIGEGLNVCLVDSIGSQANRIEPMFGTARCKGLVPQVVIRAGEERIELLKAGHRAADAIVRCSSLSNELKAAFREVLRGNAEPLAKIAPTSLVFGAWDSRDTQAKLPRVLASTIRAYNVVRLTRSAQYVPALDYVAFGLVQETEERARKSKLAEKGFTHVPSSGVHGGIVARGGIRREASLSLGALRLLSVRDESGALDDARTESLRRYVLGLSLVGLLAPVNTYLRQGCDLVPADGPRVFQLVYADGARKDLDLQFDEALTYAREAAEAFGVGPNREVDFDSEIAQAEITEDATKKKTQKKTAQPTNVPVAQ